MLVIGAVHSENFPSELPCISLKQEDAQTRWHFQPTWQSGRCLVSSFLNDRAEFSGLFETITRLKRTSELGVMYVCAFMLPGCEGYRIPSGASLTKRWLWALRTEHQELFDGLFTGRNPTMCCFALRFARISQESRKDVFGAAEREIVKILSENLLSKFKTTEEYKELAGELVFEAS